VKKNEEKVKRMIRINIEFVLCINGRKIKGRSLNGGEYSTL
jgi:hypothetical protein